MTITATSGFVSKMIALAIVAFIAAALLGEFDKTFLAELNSMSAEEFVKSERELHHRGFTVHFFTVLILLVAFWSAVEIIAHLVEKITPKKWRSDSKPSDLQV